MPYRIVCGVILHVYGLFMIGAAANVCTKIGRIDYSEPVEQVRRRIDVVKNAYLRFAWLIGFSWWLLWIPVTVCAGLDVINGVKWLLDPIALIPCLVVGVIGLCCVMLVLFPSPATWQRFGGQMASEVGRQEHHERVSVTQRNRTGSDSITASTTFVGNAYIEVEPPTGFNFCPATWLNEDAEVGRTVFLI